ncbi:MAG: site-specific integrase [Anaerolineae bacterium]|nr:MAG: tyrosine-type recombinase/integrase [Anaerolineae bacterium]MCL4879093.1 site-specific integrase [Anaerolineae bacterium]
MATQQLPLFLQAGYLTAHSPLMQTIAPFQNFLRKEGKTANTIKNFTSDVHLMCEYFSDDFPIGQISTHDLNRFLDWLEHGREKPCSRKSYARRVTTLKVLFKWLSKEKVIRDNPALAIVQRSGPAPLQPILSMYDIFDLLEHTQQMRFANRPDPRPDLLVRLLLDTGIKKSECMNLMQQHFDRRNPDRPILLIRHQKPQDIYKERRVSIEDKYLLDVLDEYVDQYQPKQFLFECSARNLEYVLTDAARAAGLEGKVSFETLRWTSAVRQYLNGIDMEELREKMGLSRISWRETSTKIVQLAERF